MDYTIFYNDGSMIRLSVKKQKYKTIYDDVIVDTSYYDREGYYQASLSGKSEMTFDDFERRMRYAKEHLRVENY